MDVNRVARTARDLGAHALTRRSVAQGGAALVIGASIYLRTGRTASAQDANATPATADASAWAEVDRLLANAAPDTVMLAAELVDGASETIHGLDADVVLPVASSFKLWVLGAVALEIQAGRLDWEQLVTIEDRYRSLPGGDLRYALAGTQYTLRYIVERMMQKSDNTATDHAFYLVGRENVEAAMVAMGHSDPALNEPIISTREIALLRAGISPEALDDYYALSVAERRVYLDGPLAGMNFDNLRDPGPGVSPDMDRVEWFATREDLSRTMAWLHAKAAEPGMRPVTEVMALETLIPFDGEIWPYAGFKIGNETGLLSATWLLQRADGRSFAYSVGFRDPAGPIDMPAALAAMEAGRDSLALIP